MTRQKKIELDKTISKMWIHLLTRERMAFDYWLDMERAVSIISGWANCSERQARKNFWKNYRKYTELYKMVQEVEY